MKCVVCKSPDVVRKNVDEEIKFENNIILIPIDALVCANCGERYYDKRTIVKLEEIKYKLKTKILELEDVGKVLRAKVT